MNILPKDIIIYIHRIVHKHYITELNREFLKLSKVYCDYDCLYWVLGFGNRWYNMRWINDILCDECKNDNILAHNECIKCNNVLKCYGINNKLPKRYIYSSGLTHPYAYKQRALI
jgi:hypothetical protein